MNDDTVRFKRHHRPRSFAPLMPLLAVVLMLAAGWAWLASRSAPPNPDLPEIAVFELRPDELEPAVESPDTPARRAGNRAFILRDGQWTEQGYRNQPVTELSPAGPLARHFLEADPGLAEAQAWEGPVVFRVGEGWFRLPP
jgi:hypothetical protein